MSFAIVKGCPTPAQLHVDALLDAVVAESGRDEDRFSLARLLLYCLKKRPHIVNTIEGSSGEEISNKEILDKSIRTSYALRNIGIKKGDIVLINGNNHLTLAVPYYASLFLGAVALHVDFNATFTELRYYLKLISPKCIFADANRMECVKDALNGIDMSPHVISFGPNVAPVQSFEVVNLEEFISDFNSDVTTFRPENVDKYDPVVLECTSGSTGTPKAAVLTNYGMLTTLYQWRIDYHTGDKISDPGLKFLLTSSSQWLTYVLYTNSCSIFGHTKIQSKKLATAEHVLELVRKYKPHASFIGPKLAASLLQWPQYRPDDLASFRTLITGGEYVSADVQSKLKVAIHPEGRVVVCCGCTEACGFYTIQSPDCPIESIGQEVNTLAFKIVDENEEKVSNGVTGELWVRGNGQMCKGYYRDEISTKDTFTADGWLKTGDLIYKDDFGRYFYVDRKKLLIKSGMYHVYPAEVEGVIADIPGVSAAGVCWTEQGLAALVAVRPGASIASQDVIDAVKAKLSFYKHLGGGAYLVPALPQTVSGKLDRGALKKEVARLQAQ